MENKIKEYKKFLKRWRRYVRKEDTVYITKPNRLAINLVNYIPPYINRIICFGCTNGRDLLPFQDKYKCIGIDFFKKKHIDFISSNIDYIQADISSSVNLFKKDKRFSDLSCTLIYSHWSLSYDNINSLKLLDIFLKNDCKNIIMLEPIEKKHDGSLLILNEFLKNNSIIKKTRYLTSPSPSIISYLDNLKNNEYVESCVHPYNYFDN